MQQIHQIKECGLGPASKEFHPLYLATNEMGLKIRTLTFAKEDPCHCRTVLCDKMGLDS